MTKTQTPKPRRKPPTRKILPVRPGGLLARTLRLLSQCDLSVSQIAEGAGVGLEWLQKVRLEMVERGNKKWDPGVKRIERLHDFLMGLGEGEAAERPLPGQVSAGQSVASS